MLFRVCCLSLFLACPLALAESEQGEEPSVEELSRSEELYEDAFALLYGDSAGNPTSRKKALKLLKEAGELGNDHAYNLLGVMYLEGSGFFKSYRKSTYSFQQAAQLNNPYAQYNLGYAYIAGRGTSKDLEAAEKQFLAVVEPEEEHRIRPGGLAEYRRIKAAAYFQLAGLNETENEDGHLEDADADLAIQYMQEAEELGFAFAALYLAIEYALGENVVLLEENSARYDAAKGFERLLSSANAGFAAAQYEVGRLVLEKELNNIDRDEAIDWLKKAADQDHGKAATLLKAHNIEYSPPADGERDSDRKIDANWHGPLIS